MPSDGALSVSQLNEYARRVLSGDPILSSVSVRGEISGFKRHLASGHWYFSLKDERARVDCCMFRQNAMGVRFAPADGMRVVITGSASLYAQAGKFQLYAVQMRQEGAGDLFARFQQLKEALRREGLFDAAAKRPLPLLPRRIGVVTSLSGAALRDILRVSRQRFPGIPVLVAPAAVQGAGAAEEIAAALVRLDRSKKVDVILCGRGGGSLEDLWAFNEEIVARAVAACHTPVISCVGHETDFTIADFVADARAATPSQAAEMAVPERAALLKALSDLRMRMERSQRVRLREKRARLEKAAGSRALADAARQIAIKRERLRSLEIRMASILPGRIRQARDRLALNQSRLGAGARRRTQRAWGELTRLAASLRSLNPAGVLERGYAVVATAEGMAESVSDIRPPQEIRVRMRDGEIRATAREVRRTGDGGKEDPLL